MLRWGSGITRHDHIRNEDIRNRHGVAAIVEKLQERRLRWYDHFIHLPRLVRTSQSMGND